jgi:CBS-domain-containing membrane protein
MMLRAADIMSERPQSVSADERYAAAEELMRERRIHALVALDAQGRVCGIVQLLRNESAMLPADLGSATPARDAAPITASADADAAHAA